MDINAIADQYSENLFKFSTELGTFYQISDVDHINLTDMSPAGIERAEDAQDKLYKTLMAVDVNQLDKNDNITYQLLKAKIKGEINQRICHCHLWSINHKNAFYIEYQYIEKISLWGMMRVGPIL